MENDDSITLFIENIFGIVRFIYFKLTIKTSQLIKSNKKLKIQIETRKVKKSYLKIN